MKTFVLTCEWNVDGFAEFEVMGVFETKESAVAALKEERSRCLNEYHYGDDKEIEVDTDTEFTIQENFYDKYEIVKIVEKETKK